MRKIKFRAWDHERKTMIPAKLVGSLLFLADDETILVNEQDNWCELMQFTGLHDKNSREIYEGDFVKYDSFAYECVGVVTFGEFDYGETADRFHYLGWYLPHSESIPGSPISPAWDESLGEVIESCEVIGNVHENPNA